MGKQLDNIRKKGTMFGVNFSEALDELKSEIVQEITQSIGPQPDVNAITDKVAAKVLGEVGVRLTEAVEKITRDLSGAKIDTGSLTQGVADLLLPQLNVAIQKASADQFQANFKTLQAELYKQLDAKVNQIRQSQNEDEPENHTQKTGSGGNWLADIVKSVLDNPEGLKTIVEIFKPAPAADTQMASTISNIFRWHKVLSQVESGKISSEELGKELSSTFTPPPNGQK